MRISAVILRKRKNTSYVIFQSVTSGALVDVSRLVAEVLGLHYDNRARVVWIHGEIETEYLIARFLELRESKKSA
jgi:hypothetical protein